MQVTMKCYANAEQAANASWQKEYEECRKKFGTFTTPEGWCPSTFDGWNCWNHTAPNLTAFTACPSFTWQQYSYSASPRQEAANSIATKFCQANGTWWRSTSGKEWANYTACFSDTSVYDFHRSLSIIWYSGYSISIISCLLALLLHHLCKFVDCGRTKVHQHLFASYVLSCCSQLAWLCTQAEVDVLMQNPLWCRILHILEIYSLLSNYAWMFCEGLYLCCVLKITFIKERHLQVGVCAFGWGSPLISLLIYISLRIGCIQHSQQLQNCWTLLVPSLWWSYAFFGLTCQLVNLMFLIAILRLVYKKSNIPAADQSNSSLKKMITLIRALFILVPLFGVQYLLSCFSRPTDPQFVLTTVYEICYSLFTSLQGACVATLFCFTNSEVRSALGRRWRRWQNARHGHSSLPKRLSKPVAVNTVKMGSISIPTRSKSDPVYSAIALLTEKRVLSSDLSRWKDYEGTLV